MSKTRTITINLDKPCKRCKKPGAADNGLCMECILKAMENGEFDHILKPLRVVPSKLPAPGKSKT
jgi:hypothetical protein